MIQASPDIYNWQTRYNSTLRRLSTDAKVIPRNRSAIADFLRSREARGLSIARIVKYGNHLIVVGRLCTMDFQHMTAEDVRELLIDLKNRRKETKCWTRTKGRTYSEHTLSDIKTMLKIFWRWMKGMDESTPAYPPEVNWFTKDKFERITVTRSDLMTPEEVDLLATATGDAQDAALIRVLEDSGGRISEILTLRIKDVEPRPYGFKLNVWVSKTYAHPIPIARSAPALAKWLSLHPLREFPDAPLWINHQNAQLFYAAARNRIQSTISRAEEASGRKFTKRVWFHLFRHTSATEFMRRRKGAPAVMNKKYGWSNGSDMWSVYAHMVDEEVEEAVARADAEEGSAKDFKVGEDTKRPRKCDRCESVNDPSARFCSRCAFPLDDRTATEVFEAEEKKSEAEELLSGVMKDERVRKVIFQVLSETSLKMVSREVSSPRRRTAGQQRWLAPPPRPRL